MTTQLDSEEKDKQAFRDFCKKNAIQIIHEYTSSENKSGKHSHDFLINNNGMEISVSLKTEGGTFTSKNLGAGKDGASKWIPEEYLNYIEIAQEEFKNRIKTIEEERWESVLDSNARKKYALEPYISTYEYVLSINKVLLNFCTYLINSKSDFVWVDGKFKKPNRSIPENLNIKRIKSKSLLINPFVELRFKSAGGKVKSAVKINVQPLLL